MEDLSKAVKEFITPIEFAIREDLSIKNTLEALQGKHISHKIIYFYVVDQDNRLKGIVPTRKLLLSKPETRISDIMDEAVVRIDENQSLQEAMEILEEKHLLALPVTNQDGIVLGIIDIQTYMEESFDVANTQHRIDVFQLIGLTLEEGKKVSIWQGYKLRMPWIFCNMAGGLTCAIISRMNEAVLSKVLTLAFFIPLILTLSESVSMQSMTQSLQTLRKGKVSWKYRILKALKEWKTVLLIALSSGLIIGSLSILWGDGIMPSVTIGLGIMISISVTSLFGILIPILLHSKSLDPKVASGPVVLTLADVLTTFVYLSLATWWLL